MSHDRTHLERVLDPEDDALLAELLPPLDERPGPARRRSGASSEVTARAIVNAALDLSEEAATEVIQALPSVRWASRRRPVVMAAAAIALFSLGAGAAVLASRVYRPEAPVPVLEPDAAGRLAGPGDQPLSVSTAEEEVEPPQVEAEPEPEGEVVAPAAPAKHRVVRYKKHRSSTPKMHSAPPATSKWLEEVDLASAPLEDMLALANRLRRGRAWRSADDVYRAVIDRFPGSDAAVVAEIASSTLRLEKLADAEGALEGYQRALDARPTGALAEEARWGIVEALRALGDHPAEVAAVKEFLAHHPVSALAPAARRRAAELGQ